MNNLKDKSADELFDLMKKHASKGNDNEFAEQLFLEDLAELGRRCSPSELKTNPENFKKYQDLYFAIHNFFLERGYYDEYGDSLKIKCLKKINETGVIVITFDDLDIPDEDVKDFLDIISVADSMSASIFNDKISLHLNVHDVWIKEWHSV